MVERCKLMSFVEHAKRELALIGGDSEGVIQNKMNKHILEMVQLFADEGHSGFSASYARQILNKLLDFQHLLGENQSYTSHKLERWLGKSVRFLFIRVASIDLKGMHTLN